MIFFSKYLECSNTIKNIILMDNEIMHLTWFSVLSQDDFHVNSRKYPCGRDNKTKLLDECRNH